MNGQRLRDYQIVIGTSADAFSGKPELQKKAPDATVLENLQFDCNIKVSNEKTKTSNDIMQLRMVNLSKEIKDQFKVTGATLMIRAGYTDASQRDSSGEIIRKPEDLPVIYVGTIEHSFTTRRGNDMVTVVYASSDKMERATTKISHAFPPSTKVTDIIEVLLKEIGFPRGHIDLSSVKSSSYVGGLSVYGKTFEQLQTVCDEWNLRFFVQNKQVNIVPVQPNANKKVDVWDVFPSDILEAPEGSYERTQTKPKDIHGKVKKKSQKRDDKETVVKIGLELKLHLDGRIKVGSFVRVNDVEDFTGVYRVEGISHSMSFIGGDWSTTLSMLPVG